MGLSFRKRVREFHLGRVSKKLDRAQQDEDAEKKELRLRKELKGHEQRKSRLRKERYGTLFKIGGAIVGVGKAYGKEAKRRKAKREKRHRREPAPRVKKPTMRPAFFEDSKKRKVHF